MKIKFCGAAQEVTGSCHLLDFGKNKVLLDCGMFQGRRQESFVKNRKFIFDPTTITEVVLSHAHIDHSGNLPTLFRNGFDGNVFSTFATRDLCRVLLEDSAHIQALDEAYFAKLKRKGMAFPFEIGPLYELDDVDQAIHHFMTVDYHRHFTVNHNLEGLFYDAGHVLGSAISYFNIRDQKRNLKIAFTGDLGRVGLPILRDPEQVSDIDYLIIESTSGNRDHDDISTAHDSLKKVINKTIARGGKIIVPAFALERTQELIYHIHLLLKEKAIPDIPIIVDSPLAVNVTDVFRMHPECYDAETNAEFSRHNNPFGFDKVRYVTSVEESKALNKLETPAIIISASGMCEAGRIRHHLANNISNSRNTILTVGYMAENTLGRKIIEREPKIKIFDQPYSVQAEICTINAFSAHADRNGLFEYVKNCQGLKKIFIVHGEYEGQKEFAERVETELKIKTLIPERGQEVEL